MTTASKSRVMEGDHEQKRTDVQSPKVCVDYLSYAFDEMDLAVSWRVMTKQKKDMVNGIRLENASWRTWAKQRNHLDTVNPDALNWLKDNDVTWLYGPLHTVVKDGKLTHKCSHITSRDILCLQKKNGLKSGSLQQRPASTISTSGLKPALKKITTSDLLKRSASELHVNRNDLMTPSKMSVHWSPYHPT